MNLKKIFYCSVFLGGVLSPSFGFAQNNSQRPPSPIIVQPNGQLVYTPDSLGNRLPDFSYAGYMAGEKPIPAVTIKIAVSPVNGDATLRIQSAIDYVASLPSDESGFRGAVLLQKGVYKIQGQIRINASGIVLRGSGANETLIIGEGNDRETLIPIAGIKNRLIRQEVNISDAYVPVNANKFTVYNPNVFRPGDDVIIHRPCTQKWIQTLGTETFGGGISALGWKPGERDLY